MRIRSQSRASEPRRAFAQAALRLRLMAPSVNGSGKPRRAGENKTMAQATDETVEREEILS